MYNGNYSREHNEFGHPSLDKISFLSWGCRNDFYAYFSQDYRVGVWYNSYSKELRFIGCRCFGSLCEKLNHAEKSAMKKEADIFVGVEND